MSSRMLKSTLLTAFLLVAVMVVSVVPVATAKTELADNKAKPADGVAIEKMIERLEPFVTRCDDGTFKLHIPRDINISNISRTSQEFKIISLGMNYVNKLIREGTLISTPNLSVYSSSDGQFSLQSNNRNEFKWRWYGFEIWLSHDVCRYIVEALSIGAIASELTAILGVTAPLAFAVAAVLGIGAIVVATNDNGCGTHLKFLSGAPPILFYAAPQTCH